MNEPPPDERYYAQRSARPQILMACFLFAGFALMLLLSLLSRPAFGLEECALALLALGVLAAAVTVVRTVYAPAVILTAQGILIRRGWSTWTCPYDRIEEFAAYTKVFHPRRQQQSAMGPRFVDYLLLRTPNGVQKFALPRQDNDRILESLQTRTGASFMELEDAKEARKWSRRRLGEKTV